MAIKLSLKAAQQGPREGWSNSAAPCQIRPAVQKYLQSLEKRSFTKLSIFNCQEKRFSGDSNHLRSKNLNTLIEVRSFENVVTHA